MSDNLFSSSTLQEEFEKINNKYKLDTAIDFSPTPTSLNLEKFNYDAPTSAEIEQQAKNALHDYASTSQQNIDTSYQTNLKKLFEQEEKLAETNATTKNSHEAQTEQAKQSASNNALKRGLARSTIVVSQMAAFDQDKLNHFAALDAEYTKALTKLENEKTLLETQKQNALNSFDIAYAVKLSDKIATINEAVEKKLTEVQKLNNEIAKTEAAFTQAAEKENIRRAQEAYEWNQAIAKELALGQSSTEKLKQEEKFQVAINYFNNLSKSEALSIINQNEALKTELGPLYTRLHAAISSRTN